jgi:biotin-dependent carboxylase-like uncharacterized protein
MSESPEDNREGTEENETSSGTPLSVEITSVRGLVTVQDLGRPGRMHEGIPPGGALVPELAARANQVVGNQEGAALFEVFGGITISPRRGSLPVAREDGTLTTVAEGEAFELASSNTLRVRYLAVAGGLAVPLVLGGRGTLLMAALGGYEGRSLRRGDRVEVGRPARAARGSDARKVPAMDLSRRIRVMKGPDLDRFSEDALQVLTGRAFRVLPTSDRGGTRLEGPRLARVNGDSGLSSPMVRGAIQVPAAGAPIVLGPDHPTTGGYPVLAVVVRADLGLFFARPLGAEVRFDFVV